MAYINNGTERSLKVSVYKTVGGNYAQGYPIVYDGQISWGNVSYPTLTDTEVRQLSDAEFNARLAAFQLYVEGIEAGASFGTDIVGDGPTRSNPGVCTPTTTTTSIEVWSFAVKHAYWPSDACSGVDDIAYSDKQFPTVGDFLYQDEVLSIPWAKAPSILMVNPAVYGNKTILLAVVDTATYDIGEITDVTNGVDCSTVSTTTTTTTTIAPNAIIQVINNTTGYVIQEGDDAIEVGAVSTPNARLMFTINNIGTTVMEASVSVSSSGDVFELVTDPSGDIQPGFSAIGMVEYKGPSTSTVEGIVTIINDSTNDTSFVFSVIHNTEGSGGGLV